MLDSNRIPPAGTRLRATSPNINSPQGGCVMLASPGGAVGWQATYKTSKRS